MASARLRLGHSPIYAEAGSEDRAANETAEADLIEKYLPASLSPEQIDALIADAITATGATGPKDMGTVMKAVNAAAAGQGRVDGKVLSQAVRTALAG